MTYQTNTFIFSWQRRTHNAHQYQEPLHPFKQQYPVLDHRLVIRHLSSLVEPDLNLDQRTTNLYTQRSQSL